MKKVLVIAYQFPPMGGSGIQRTSKFVKYLGNFGWEPVVLTRATHGMALKDESLLKDIPEDIKVVRTASWDFTELPGVLKYPGKFLGRKVLIPDNERLWQLAGRKTAEKLVSDEGIDAIYTTSYPYSDHLMGLYLKQLFPDIPWVADFRDEWMNNPYLLDKPHNHVRMSIEGRMEKRVLQNADYLVTNTPVMLENFLRNHKDIHDLKDRFCFIPNGYDKEDFKDLPSAKPENVKFTMTYTGLLYGQRTPDTLFEAVRRLIAEKAVDGEKIKIKLIGNYKADYMNSLVEKYQLKDIVEIFPYMKHSECLKHLMASDCLLHIEGAGKGSEAFYSGKIFEYMNTGRPVLAIIPSKGAAAGLIRDTGIGLVSDSSDIAGTMENIKILYNSWTNKFSEYKPNMAEISKYDRLALTERLAEILHKLTKN